MTTPRLLLMVQLAILPVSLLFVWRIGDHGGADASGQTVLIDWVAFAALLLASGLISVVEKRLRTAEQARPPAG